MATRTTRLRAVDTRAEEALTIDENEKKMPSPRNGFISSREDAGKMNGHTLSNGHAHVSSVYVL